MLQIGQIRVHFNDGSSSIYPELNKNNIVRMMQGISRIEHFKPAFVGGNSTPKKIVKKKKK